MKLKTLHLTNAWHATSGGISVFYRALLEEAERRRRFLRLVVPGDRDNHKDLGEFTRVYSVRAPVAPFNSAYRMIHPQFYLPPCSRIARILRQERPDLVEISDKYALNYLGGLLRERWIPGLSMRPTVVGISCERMDENVAVYLGRGPWAARLARWYMKWIYFPLFDHHLAVSEHTASELRQASRGHKVRRGVWVLPMGVDLKWFSPARRHLAKRALFAGTDETLMLYAGRLAPEKNLNLLIEMLEKLPSNYRLLIAGDGIHRRELEQAAASRTPGRVQFLGHIDCRETLANLLANADVFVHPNPREPFGISLLEAMASGTPLVAPNTGGLTSFADNSNAWLVHPDAKAFAASVLAVINDPTERRQKTRSARRTAERFDWPAIAARFLQLYEELHAVTQGHRANADTAPLFYSSPGDYWGREIRAESTI